MTKLEENPTLNLHKVIDGFDNEGLWVLENDSKSSGRADEDLAKQVGENRMTIQRYVRLTNVIPKILDMVDEI